MPARQQCVQALRDTIKEALLQHVMVSNNNSTLLQHFMVSNNDSIASLASEHWTSNPAAANCVSAAPTIAVAWVLLQRQKSTK